MIVFGPVPSRRLSRSLGINNIPPKVCTYSCVYCQVGRTMRMQVKREAFYDPQEILEEVKDKVDRLNKIGERLDYLTFVTDGEPTLDINLKEEISLLKPLGIKIAVISNSSLIWKPEVQADLQKADWVSLKVDSIDEKVWRRINRPHRLLNLDKILGGMLRFADSYRGELATEIMLVKGYNDSEDNLKGISEFLMKIKPRTAYLAIPTRPPAEKQIEHPDEDTIIRVYQILSEKMANVEYLIGYEGNTFSFTGNTEEDLLSITSVHPMRKDAVREFLNRANASWEVIEKLMQEDKLAEVTHDSKKFYMRKFSRSKNKTTTKKGEN